MTDATLDALSTRVQLRIVAELDAHVAMDTDVPAPVRARLAQFRQQLVIEPVASTYLELVRYARSVRYDYLAVLVRRAYRLAYRLGVLWLKARYPDDAGPMRDDHDY